MKIAVGTVDGATVCEHLARSSAFVVFEVNGGRPRVMEVRKRAAEECGNHRMFVEMLEGCDAVICGGIGQGAVDPLMKAGIRPVVALGKHSVEGAVSLFIEGRLATTDERVCLCQ